VIDYNSCCLYACALISKHLCEVAIPLARADARGIGNGFGILSQHGAIDETLDVLRVEPQSLLIMSAAAVATNEYYVVISMLSRLLYWHDIRRVL
jgi:hypothetical protein